MTDLIEAAVVGDEAKKFMEGELGRKILSVIEEEIAEAQIKLESVNPTDHEGIDRIQRDIAQARRFPKYLTDLLTKGEEALRAYKQQQESD